MQLKERIIKKSNELFVEYGVKRVTMDEISSSLNISKRTLYENFNDKESLVIDVFKSIISEDNSAAISIIDNSDNITIALIKLIKRKEDYIKTLSPAFISDFKRYFPKVLDIIYNCKQKHFDYSVSYRLLEKGLKQGVIRDNINIALVDIYLHRLIILIHDKNSFKPLKIKKADIINSILLPFYRGICTDKGLKQLDEVFNNNFKINI